MTAPPAGTSAQRHPVGSGYKVVYEDDRASNWDIFVFDTLDPEPATREKQLTTDLGDQLDPDIYSSWVVFEDKSAGNWNIGLYDLYTSTGRLLTTNAADQVNPADRRRSRSCFADRRNGNWDIYSCNVQDGEAKAADDKRRGADEPEHPRAAGSSTRTAVTATGTSTSTISRRARSGASRTTRITRQRPISTRAAP